MSQKIESNRLPETSTPYSSQPPRQEFFAFDRAYVERLRDGDPLVAQHFFAYFEQFLNLKLRARALPHDRVEDLRQETFIRVIAAVRKEGGVRQPERFGAFVNAVCNNVLLEHYRSLWKNQQIDETHQEIPDKVLDLEGMMVSNQSSAHVRKILFALPARDRDMLRAVFLEERDKDAVCREFGVDRNYLRVLLHRAKDKFKEQLQRSGDSQVLIRLRELRAGPSANRSAPNTSARYWASANVLNGGKDRSQL